MNGRPREYTEGELWLAVRQERASLTRERRGRVEEIQFHSNRIEEIDARFLELDKAENILEGGL